MKKQISKAFKKGLESILSKVRSDMAGQADDMEWCFTIISALVTRWILLIRFDIDEIGV